MSSYRQQIASARFPCTLPAVVGPRWTPLGLLATMSRRAGVVRRRGKGRASDDVECNARNTYLSVVQPVERLVGERIGVHENTAVAFEHEQPCSNGQMSAEAARVVHGAAGNDESHEYEGSPECSEACGVGSKHQIHQ